jgi:hypothetical protein
MLCCYNAARVRLRAYGTLLEQGSRSFLAPAAEQSITDLLKASSAYEIGTDAHSLDVLGLHDWIYYQYRSKSDHTD